MFQLIGHMDDLITKDINPYNDVIKWIKRYKN